MEIVKPSDVIATYDSGIARLARQEPSAALNQLENSRCLSKAGKDWFLLATDPFHDERLTLSGYPDTNVAGSVVQCVKQSVAISSPFGTTASDPVWDINLCDFPQLSQYVTPASNSGTGLPYTQLTANFGAIDSGADQIQGYYIGGLQGFACATGGTTYGSVASLGGLNVAGLALPSSYWSGVSRIIGKGFEIVNTTAPLYKQGQVTCYRQPCTTPNNTANQLIATDSAAYVATGNLETWATRQPPGSLAEAQLLEGSQTWDAEQGCYVVGVMNQSENEAKSPMPVASLYMTDDVTGANRDEVVTTYPATGRKGCIGNASVQSAPVSGDVYLGALSFDHIAPFNLSGAYLTGLSPQTTLQLTYKVFVERFPDPSNLDLVVLANPSSGYDACALELYANTISKMPVGVPQGENSLGDWFKGVVNKVSSFATPVLKMLAPMHPALGAAAGFSGMVKNLTGNEQQAIKGRRQINNITDDLASVEERRIQRRERRRRKRALTSNGSVRPRLRTA